MLATNRIRNGNGNGNGSNYGMKKIEYVKLLIIDEFWLNFLFSFNRQLNEMPKTNFQSQSQKQRHPREE